MRMHMTFHIKVRSSITYNVLLTEIGEPPIGLHACKLSIGFPQWLAHLPSCWFAWGGHYWNFRNHVR
jgi:hypothetical protein